MTATRTETVSARVTPDLKRDLQFVAHRAGETDLSFAVRRALRRYVDAELGRGPAGNLGLLAGGQGTARRNGTETERNAALAVAPRVGTARRLALEAFERAANAGLTADQINVELAPRPQNSTARRVTDLLQGGLIVERQAPPRVGPREERLPSGLLARLTRHGVHAQVYVITPDGRRALEDARDNERRKARA